jgi:hypothetical protein
MIEDGLSENTQVKANLAFMAKTIALVGTAVWGYSVVWNKISALENENIRMHHEMELNSEFRIKWPRGEIGALPADATQDDGCPSAEVRNGNGKGVPEQ